MSDTVTSLGHVTVPASRSMLKLSLVKWPSGAVGICTLVMGTAPNSSRARLVGTSRLNVGRRVTLAKEEGYV